MNKPRMYCLAFACLISVFSFTTANAEIVLTINTAAETWELSGSDSGNPGFSSDTNTVFWQTLFFGGDATFITQQSPAFTFSGWNPNAFNVGKYIEAPAIDAFQVQLTQATFTDLSNTNVTVFAIGGPIDYMGHSAAHKLALEGLIGSMIPLRVGTGFSDISVQGVPEPTSFALFGIALVGMARRRRQR